MSGISVSSIIIPSSGMFSDCCPQSAVLQKACVGRSVSECTVIKHDDSNDI